ncbi:MAG: dihydrolipoyl dehydrogenase [Candidatus Adiutrix sp.]|jgi:dihydrolipoamide dehydrogenase|nr:dihydrolipoyl dehydrogenase [Candidatus Adiutrix sp.]
MSEMNIVVIGAGPGGYAAAIRASQLGAKVTLAEKDRPGGVCLNRGCIPSKIMRRTADAAREAAEAAAFGVSGAASPVEVDMGLLRERQKKIVEAQAQGLAKHFKALGINLVKGEARVEAPGAVEVIREDGKAEKFSYDHLLIAVGSVPASLPGLTIDGRRIISSDQALWMETKPRRLLVVGGGVIGCELAQIFHDFGSQVVLVEGLNRLLPLPGLDEEISKVYMRGLKKIKLPFFTGQTVAEVREGPGGLTAVIRPFSGEGAAREMEFDQILVSIGRRPAVAGLGLEALGLTLDGRGWVEAGEDFRTKAPNVWAIGDCLGPSRVMLAHVATAEGLAAAENMFGGRRRVDYGQVPSAVFTAPEIGFVGLTLAQAQEKRPGSKAGDFLFRQLGKAQALGETDGLTRLVAGPDGRILGGHIIGPSATTLIAEAAAAVSCGLTAEDLAATIHAHPTLSEGLWEAALSLAGRPLHGAS